jgi:hypothetical protein
MRVINPEKFSKVATELSNKAIELYNVTSPVVTKNNRDIAKINENTVDSIKSQYLSLGAKSAIKKGIVSNSDVGMLMQVIDRIHEMVPSADIQVMDPDEIASVYGPEAAKSKGILTPNNGLIINIRKYTLDTPFHEYAHLTMKYLKEHNPSEYALIVTKALEHESVDAIMTKYPNLSPEEIGEEVFVTQVGLRAAEKFTSSTDVENAIQGFFSSLSQNIFGTDSEDKINLTDSINTLIDKYTSQLFNRDSIFNSMSPAQVDSILQASFKGYNPEDMYKQLQYSGYIRQLNGKSIYLGVDGRYSKEYYDNVKHMGEDGAKKHYLAFMSNFVKLKFQKPDNIDVLDLLDQADTTHKNLKHTKDAKFYIDTVTGELFNRATGFIEPFISEFDQKVAADKEVKREYLKGQREIFKINNEDKITNKTLLEEEADKFANAEYNKLTRQDLDIMAQPVIDRYTFNREEGTFIHSMAEDYIRLRQEISDKKWLVKQGKLDPKDAYIEVKDYKGLDIDESPLSFDTSEDFERYTNSYTVRKIYMRDWVKDIFSDLIAIEATRPRIVRDDEGKII